jgi:hypothetical protein
MRLAVGKVFAPGLALVVGLSLLATTPAKAWWGPYGYGYGWRAPVVVVPPVVYAPPPVVYAPRVGAFWVRPYWFGGHFYRGHWR